MALLIFALGCKGDSEEKAKPESQQDENEAKQAEKDASADESDQQAARAMRPGPGTHKGGRKFKDCGVYVDGDPVAVLEFGELPLSLEPVWVEGKRDVEFSGGEEPPEPETIKYRRYRLAEYLEALGVNLRKVKEVHIYGGVYAGSLRGKDLRRARDTIYFGFGRTTHGKALFYPPPDVSIGTSFDSIAAIAVYIDKKPPTIRENATVEFEGKTFTDIPYYGEPLRGGIRVYKDDRMVHRIKRKRLRGSDELAYWEGDELRWKLAPYLESHGVEIDDVAAAEIIRFDRRVKRLSGEEVQGTYFVAQKQKGGEVTLGEEGIPMDALALYTRELPPRKEDDVRYAELSEIEKLE